MRREKRLLRWWVHWAGESGAGRVGMADVDKKTILSFICFFNINNKMVIQKILFCEGR